MDHGVNSNPCPPYYSPDAPVLRRQPEARGRLSAASSTAAPAASLLPFFVAAGLCLLNSLYGFLVLPESLAPENRSAFSLRKANPVSSIAHLRTYPLVASLAVAMLPLVRAFQRH